MAKRKRAQEESSSCDGNVDLQQLMEDAAAALGRAPRTRKKYIGVRQRPSGRWVAEIKDTIHNIRVWLGTYDTAEDAARAYDEAACMLRGTNTRTNFSRRDYPNPKPALPSKISNLLLLRLKARIEASNTAAAAASFHNSLHHEQVIVEESSFDTSSYLNLHADGVIRECNDAASSNSPGAVNVNGSTELSSTDQMCISTDHQGVGYNWPGTVDDSNPEGCRKLEEKEELEEYDMGIIDFEFLDSIESNFQFSPFEIVQEMVAVEEENSVEKPSTVEETVKRMKYERKFSASLYAFNGVSECLRLKNGSADSSNGLENYEVGQVITSNGMDSHMNHESIKNEEDSYFEQMLQEQIQCMSNLVESSSSMSSS